MSKEIRVYHSPRSPYSRLGLHVLKNAGLSDEVKIKVIAFTGPPEGTPFADPMANVPKLAYFSQDAPRMTMRMGLPIRRPDPFDVDLVPSARAIAAADAARHGLDYGIAVADARWGKGLNIAELDVLAACADEIGWSGDAVHAAQTDDAVTALLAENRQLIEEDQAFGVPFAVFDGQKFWGHDRFDLLVEAVNG